MTKKIVLAMVDETGVRVPEARACVWADYTTARRDSIIKHIQAERGNHLWIGYFVLDNTKDILAIARNKALRQLRLPLPQR